MLKEVWEEREKTLDQRAAHSRCSTTGFEKKRYEMEFFCTLTFGIFRTFPFIIIKKLCDGIPCLEIKILHLIKSKAVLFHKNGLKDSNVICQVNSSTVDASAHVLC